MKEKAQMPTWQDKRVLVTGVAGTVGQEILRQLLASGVHEIVGIDNSESKLFFLEQSYAAQKNVRFYLCDIKDRDSLMDVMRGCDIVLHSAAFKHVPLCEKSPRSAVDTNIIGVENVIDAAFATGVKRVLFTSSDKAVNPTNVMGTSKLMGERLVTAANMRRGPKDPIFGVTRFGNVLGSDGSVIPLFRRQIEQGGPVTVTHADMTRFIMNLDEAVNLVLSSALLFQGGEVFITKMPVIRIIDLAEAMIEELSPQKKVDIKIIGPRPGEKMYEELLNEEEVRRTLESREFFIVKPALESSREYVYGNMPTSPAKMPYTSAIATSMSKDELRLYLYTHGLISKGETGATKLKAVHS